MASIRKLYILMILTKNFIVEIPLNLLNSIESSVSQIASLFASAVPSLRELSEQIGKMLNSAVIKNGFFSKCIKKNL